MLNVSTAILYMTMTLSGLRSQCKLTSDDYRKTWQMRYAPIEGGVPGVV